MKGKSFIVYGFAVIDKRTRINWIVQLAILKLDSDRCGMSCYQAIKVWPSQSIIKTIDHQFVEKRGLSLSFSQFKCEQERKEMTYRSDRLRASLYTSAVIMTGKYVSTTYQQTQLNELCISTWHRIGSLYPFAQWVNLFCRMNCTNA